MTSGATSQWNRLNRREVPGQRSSHRSSLALRGHCHCQARASEPRCDVQPRPSGDTQLGPSIVVLGVTRNRHHRVDRRRPTDTATPTIDDRVVLWSTTSQQIGPNSTRLCGGVEEVRAAHPRAGRRVGTGFEKENLPFSSFAQPAGQHAPRRAGPNDDDVESGHELCSGPVGGASASEPDNDGVRGRSPRVDTVTARDRLSVLSTDGRHPRTSVPSVGPTTTHHRRRRGSGR